MFKRNTAKFEINVNEISKGIDAIDDKSLERMMSSGKLDFATVGLLLDKAFGRDFIMKAYKFFNKLSRSPGEFEMPKAISRPKKVLEFRLEVDVTPNGSLLIKAIDGISVKDDK